MQESIYLSEIQQNGFVLPSASVRVSPYILKHQRFCEENKVPLLRAVDCKQWPSQNAANRKTHSNPFRSSGNCKEPYGSTGSHSKYISGTTHITIKSYRYLWGKVYYIVVSPGRIDYYIANFPDEMLLWAKILFNTGLSRPN